ncbi:hypothetical protein LUZ60_013908 [Juncus effusus]|nr:hypothetical protein LUZ60_013908 [Juncus effusus]
MSLRMVLLKAAYIGCLALIMSRATLGDKLFDVTKYGASTGGSFDSNAKAFLDAWKALCAFNGPTTFLVPTGTYKVGPVSFKGPCSPGKNKVKFHGNLVAPSSLDSFKDKAWIEYDGLHEITVEGGGELDGQGAEAWSKKKRNSPISLRFINIISGRITNLKLKDGKGFHIAIHKSHNIVIKAISVTAPGDSPNTDGIHVSGSTRVQMRYITVGTGDDCISIGPGSYNVSIANVNCGPGHGISIGSLGKYQNEENVAHIRVKNCTISETTNGLRIKTWPGSPASEAFNITFEDINMKNVANPIIIDQDYCPNNQCNTNAPSKVKLHGIAFRRIRGTSSTPEAVTLNCSKDYPCKDVSLVDIVLKPQVSSVVQKVESMCSNVIGIAFGAQQPDPCVGKH